MESMILIQKRVTMRSIPIHWYSQMKFDFQITDEDLDVDDQLDECDFIRD